MRGNIIAGNWKMNKNMEETEKLLATLAAKLPDTQAEVMVAPPFTSLAKAVYLMESSVIEVIAQNMHYEDSGAYTGEISADMLLNIKIDTVILGHSERRAYSGETDAILAKKVNTAVAKNMRVIFCVGEQLADRKSENHFKIVEDQMKAALFHLEAASWERIVLAYEPVWAIGTGETASPEQAQEMHAFLRKTVADNYDTSIANNLTILYGGSVKPDNAAEIFQQPDVDGGLVGGASLSVDDFMDIVNAI